MNMNQILLLLVFYSSLSTSGMIFTVSLVLCLTVVDGGPMAARVPVCSVACFNKDGMLVMVGLVAHLPKPLASQTTIIQIPSIPECFLMYNHLSCGSPSPSFQFYFHLAYSLSRVLFT